MDVFEKKIKEQKKTPLTYGFDEWRVDKESGDESLLTTFLRDKINNQGYSESLISFYKEFLQLKEDFKKLNKGKQ